MSRTDPNILVIESKIPAPDRDSGSLRMYNLLLVLKNLASNLTFGSHLLFHPTLDTQSLETEGIHFLKEPVKDHLEHSGSEYDIVILSRAATASAFIEDVGRYADRSKIVFDTVDLHHLRFFRQARITGDAQAMKLALLYKEQEIKLTRVADCTLVVSSIEQTILMKICPDADIRIVSNIHNVYPTAATYEDRTDIFFIGSFYHKPNIDAVLFYANEIHPLLKTMVPGIKCYIIGENPPPGIKSLDSQDLIITGYVPDILPYMERCRLSIAPLRYGAGIKGKVLLSMSYGIPVIGTSVAAEGMPLTKESSLMIADSAEDFCQAIQNVYTNGAVWDELSVKGKRLVQNHFSFEAARSTLVELFEDFGYARLQ